jgi:hypothetical protein
VDLDLEPVRLGGQFAELDGSFVHSHSLEAGVKYVYDPAALVGPPGNQAEIDGQSF